MIGTLYRNHGQALNKCMEIVNYWFFLFLWISIKHQPYTSIRLDTDIHSKISQVHQIVLHLQVHGRSCKQRRTDRLHGELHAWAPSPERRGRFCCQLRERRVRVHGRRGAILSPGSERRRRSPELVLARGSARGAAPSRHTAVPLDVDHR